jgi:hypothetical protein
MPRRAIGAAFLLSELKLIHVSVADSEFDLPPCP